MTFAISPVAAPFAASVVATTPSATDSHHMQDEAHLRRRAHHHHDADTPSFDDVEAAAEAESDPTHGTLINVKA